MALRARMGIDAKSDKDQPKMSMAELFSGDGSLAQKILDEHGQNHVSSYTMFERNALLVEESKRKLYFN